MGKLKNNSAKTGALEPLLGLLSLVKGAKKKKRADLHPSLKRARLLANLLDSSFTIPFTRKKIGLDPLLGLLPVGGDIPSMLLALYMMRIAHDLGLPRHVMIRMGLNLLPDLLLGSVPVVGRLADAFWKANRMNLKLLEDSYRKYGRLSCLLFFC